MRRVRAQTDHELVHPTKVDRDLADARRRLMHLSKTELVERLLAVETSYAAVHKRVVAFEAESLCAQLSENG